VLLTTICQLDEEDNMSARGRKMNCHDRAPLAGEDGVAYLLIGEEDSMDEELD
jgi:hypothetical protein